MPKKFHISLPNQKQRVSILRLTLKDVKLEDDFPYEEIARQTEGLSGSDLKELCRTAAMAPIQEYMGTLKGDLSSLETKSKNVGAPLFKIFFIHWFTNSVVLGRILTSGPLWGTIFTSKRG